MGCEIKFSTSRISREAAKNAKELIFNFAATKKVEIFVACRYIAAM